MGGSPRFATHIPPPTRIRHFPLPTSHSSHNTHTHTTNIKKQTTNPLHTHLTHTHTTHTIYTTNTKHTHTTQYTHSTLAQLSTLHPPGDAEDAEDVEDAGCWNLWKTSPNITPRSRLSTSFPNKRFHLHFCHNFGGESFFLVMNFQRLMGLFSTLSNI